MFGNTSFEVITSKKYCFSCANFFKNNYGFTEQSLRKSCLNTVGVFGCNCLYCKQKVSEILRKEFDLKETKLTHFWLMFPFYTP